MEYKFESEQFAFSEEAIHLLRNRFEYKSYTFKQIEKIRIDHGKLINNWIVILLLGIGLTGFAIYHVYAIYLAFNSDELARFYIEELAIPIISLLIGLYCLYSSLKSGPVIQIAFSDGKNKRFSLQKAKKENQIDAFLNLLKGSPGLNSKSQINI